MEKKYYVYEHRTLKEDELFYIGKGSGKRIEDNNSRNSDWHQKAPNGTQGIKCNLIKSGLTSEEARLLEEEMILKVGYDNLTNVGQGAKHGVGKSDAWKKSASKSHTDRYRDSEERKKTSKSTLHGIADRTKEEWTEIIKKGWETRRRNSAQ